MYKGGELSSLMGKNYLTAVNCYNAKPSGLFIYKHMMLGTLEITARLTLSVNFHHKKWSAKWVSGKNFDCRQISRVSNPPMSGPHV